MDYLDFLKTCTKKDGSLLNERTIIHYHYGLKVISDDRLREQVINKPLTSRNLYELDIAIALIYKNPFFQDKDKVGKKRYSNALKHFRLYVSSSIDNPDSDKKEVAKIEKDIQLTKTEKETIVKARIGQGLYRERLRKKYNGRCIITQISIPEVLIASHIKPWAVSNNKERISSDNGFLLSSTYDRLFDQGLISFQDDGKILISNRISNENADLLSLDKSRYYDIQFVPTMKTFLQYHRDIIFVG